MAHEEAINFSGNELRRDRLLQNNVDGLLAIEGTAATQYILDAIVVFFGYLLELDPLIIPTGKGARRFANIFFAVVAHAHGEQLHDLAREVFVRCALHVHSRIEKRQHRRILRRADQQLAKIARALGLKQRQLTLHFAIVANLFFIIREMAVPKQRHLFFQRPLGR